MKSPGYFTIATIIFLLTSFTAQAQNPLVKQWDKRYGCALNDFAVMARATPDSGYILAGSSVSDSCGEKTTHQHSIFVQEYWVIKIDKNGNKQWDAGFGGISDDRLTCLEVCPNGDYIIGGYSSDGGGDHTEAHFGGPGLSDAWVVKMDNQGHKLWDKALGGINEDLLYDIKCTRDGGFILGGGSRSQGTGNVPSSPTDSLGYSGFDFWITKLDSLGNIQWNKMLGGFGGDTIRSILPLKDGGYLLAGTSNSNIGFDKSQNNRGGADIWVVKTDDAGNKIWDKTYGGNLQDIVYSQVETPDGNYLLTGSSCSAASGERSQYSAGGLGDYDYWTIKIDPAGNKLWDKSFGGFKPEDEYGNTLVTDDGGLLFAGTSYSGISGSKTENNFGQEQMWVVKTDANGNKLWDKTVFSKSIYPVTPDDETGYAVQTTYDGCYLFLISSPADSGGEKTQMAWGGYDYWAIKFCDTTFRANATAVTANCNDSCSGTATARVYNGQQPFTYLWAPTGETTPAIDNLCPGTYTVKITDNTGRDVYDTVTIQAHQYYNTQIHLSDSIVCVGDSVTICAPSGYAGYLWNNGATTRCFQASAAGNYYVSVTDFEGCELATAPVQLLNYPAPPVTVSVSGDTLRAYNAAQYQWYQNGYIIQGATSSSLIVQHSGNYTVQITDTNGCRSTSVGIPVTTSVDNLNSTARLYIYPNPSAEGKWYIDADEQLIGSNWQITDASGKKVSSGTIKETTSVISLSVNSGIYMIQIYNGKNLIIRKLINM